MKQAHRTWLALVTALAAVGACQSKADENSTGGSAGGTPGQPQAGAPSGGQASHSSAGNAGTTGKAGDANEAGSPAVDRPGGTGGTDDGAGGATAPAGGGGETDAGAGEGGEGGEGGSVGSARPEFAYLSTFLGGIFAFSIDLASGRPEPLPGPAVDATAQIYAVSVDPSQRHLYVLDLVHKLDVFAINADGTLPATPASSTPIQGSPGTLALDLAGRFAYVGTRTDDPKGFIESFKIDATSGALSSAGAPLEVDGAPAYVAVDPTGHFAYLTKSTSLGIWGYSINQTTGLLTAVDPLPFGGTAVFGGAIAFRPDGKFLYTSGNGLNAFAIDHATGKLERVEGSPFNANVSSDPTASNLAISPSGKFLYATQFVAGSHVFGFSIDEASGKLTPVPGNALNVTAPYSAGLDPLGRFLYVGRDDGKLSVLAVKQSDGSLSEIEGSPVDKGGPQPELAFARLAAP